MVGPREGVAFLWVRYPCSKSRTPYLPPMLQMGLSSRDTLNLSEFALVDGMPALIKFWYGPNPPLSNCSTNLRKGVRSNYVMCCRISFVLRQGRVEDLRPSLCLSVSLTLSLSLYIYIYIYPLSAGAASSRHLQLWPVVKISRFHRSSLFFSRIWSWRPNLEDLRFQICKRMKFGGEISGNPHPHASFYYTFV